MLLDAVFFRKKNILEVTWEMLKVSMTSKKQLRMIQNGLHFFKIYVYIYIICLEVCICQYKGLVRLCQIL